MAKRRNVNKEKRVFKDSWADLYFFVEQKEKPICLICNESVSVNKEYNLKRHHETKYKGYNEFKPRERKEKLEKLKSNLDRQQTIFKKQNNETEKNTKTNYIVSYLIAKKIKPFTETEFIDKCMMSFVREVCSEQKGAFENISFSVRTVTQRIEELSEDVKETLQDLVNSFQYYSVPFEESTDVRDQHNYHYLFEV